MKSFSKSNAQSRVPNLQQINKLLQLINANQLPEALVVTQKMIKSAPKDSFAWKALGLIRHKEHNFTEAVAAFQRAYQYNPYDYEALENLGKLHLLQTDFTKAKHYFQLLIDLDPYNENAINNLIECLYNSGEFKASLAPLRMSLQHRLNAELPNSTSRTDQNFNRLQQEQVLWSTLVDLAKASVHAFAIADTLLGLVREGKLLQSSIDLEIGLPIVEMEHACTTLMQLGWIELNSQLRLLNPRSFKQKQTGIVLNLFGFALEPNTQNVVSGFWQKGQAWNQQLALFYPNNFELKKKQIDAGIIWEVIYVDDFLSAVYGDWRTPDPDFDTLCCAKNLRSYTDMVQMFTLNRIRKTWSENQLHKTLKLIDQHLRFIPNDPLILDIQVKLVKQISIS